MIKVHEVIGSKNTTIHDFKVTTEGMKLKINGTHYTAGRQELFINYAEEMTTVVEKELDENMQEVEVEKQVPTGVKIPLEGTTIDIQAGYEYQVWLCQDGIVVLTKEIRNDESQFDAVPDNMIDRLAWFSVLQGITTLDDVEINVIEIREG